MITSLTTVPTTCSATPTGSATVAVSGGIAPYQYLWDPSLQTTPTATALQAGTYSVSVVDANGCIVTSNATVTSPSDIRINGFTITNPTCFNNTNGSVNSLVSGGVGAITYNWNTTPAQTTPSLSNLSAGTYSLTVTDSNGCSFTKDTILKHPPQLTASLASVQNVKCYGDTNGRATPTVTGGTPFNTPQKYQFSWNDPAAQTSVTAINLTAGSYILTVTDALGCTDTMNVTISAPGTPLLASATPTKIACFGQNTGEATVAASGGTPGYSYRWSEGTTSRNVTNLSAQVYYVTVTDLNGCVALDTINISTYPAFNVQYTIAQPRCFGDANGTITLNSVYGGAGAIMTDFTYFWSTGAAQTATQATNLRGNRSYSLTVTDTAGCQSINTFFMPEPVQMSVSTSKSDVKCFGATDGTATALATGAGRGYTYLWSTNANNQMTATANNLATGTYIVTATEDSTGCKATATVSLAEPTRIRVSTTDLKAASCSGTPDGSLTVAISGGTPNYTYNWSNGVSNSLSLNNLSAGGYTISVTDANGCLLTETVSVASPNALDGEVSFTNIRCFGGSDGTITIDAFGGTPPYSYSINDGKSFIGSSKTVGLRIGNYPVTIKDAKGCLWKQQVTITAPPQFTIKAMPDVTIKLGDSIQLHADAANAQGNVTLTWKAPYAGIMSCSKCPTPIANPQYTAIYGVFAADSMGCRAADSVKVIVEKDLTILVPTGFSPNDDQNNDNLYVRGKNGTKILLFRIYDRWGELLFEARDFNINDPDAGWDGRFRGQPMTSGVYVWYVEAQYLDGQKGIFKGNTTLIR
jgi:gliding motility-associated-like protein